MDIISIYIFMLGLCIGSFLNVCIDRIAEEKSIIWPASHCDNCGCRLKAIDLIPVLSYIFLRGRCRRCHNKISVQYPIIELVNAVLYLCVYYKYGIGFYFVKYCILISFMLVISVIDIKTKTVYTKVCICGVICGILVHISGYKFLHIDFSTYIFGALIGFIVFYVIVKITKSMGRGDIDAAVLCGLFLGGKYTILTILLSFILGGIIAVVLMCFKLKKRDEEVAFTPYLALGVYISIFLGDILIKWYLNCY